jgi:hypothetical protein
VIRAPWRPQLHCPLCDRDVDRFRPLPSFYLEEWERNEFPYGPGDFETLNVPAYSCPHCDGADRERFYALFVDSELRARPPADPLRMLDIAPVPWLTSYLRRSGWFDYRSADLEDPSADDRVDVMDMPYDDASFDAFVCSHVLEHVADDRAALGELARVLRPGGWGIVMVPICLRVDATTEDTTVTASEGWRRFGQHDHVRLYDRAGFLDRIESAGLAVESIPAKAFGRDSRRAGIAPGSRLYVVRHREGKRHEDRARDGLRRRRRLDPGSPRPR